MIEQQSSKTIYRNKWVHVREDIVLFANDSQGTYTVVDKPNFVLILPFDGEHFYLVEQYRYPIQKRFLEFPAGSHEELKIKNEIQLVQDELEEETGITSKKITFLTTLHEVPGLINQKCLVYLAEGLTQGMQKLEHTESDLKIIKLDSNEIEEAIKYGNICDAKTIAAYFFWKLQDTLK